MGLAIMLRFNQCISMLYHTRSCPKYLATPPITSWIPFLLSESLSCIMNYLWGPPSLLRYDFDDFDDSVDEDEVRQGFGAFKKLVWRFQEIPRIGFCGPSPSSKERSSPIGPGCRCHKLQMSLLRVRIRTFPVSLAPFGPERRQVRVLYFEI